MKPSLAAPTDFPDAWGVARRWSADEETPFERMRVLEPEPDRDDLAREITLPFRDFMTEAPVPDEVFSFFVRHCCLNDDGKKQRGELLDGLSASKRSSSENRFRDRV